MVLSAVVALVTIVGAGTAGAHGGEGELTVTKVEQTGPTTVAVEVGIVYENDGHLAEDASVSATLTGPDGASVGPVELARTGDTTSLYAASIEVPGPGDWKVAVTSTEPEGSAEGTVAVVADADTATTAAPPATEAPTTAVAEDTTDDSDAAVTAEPLTTTAAAEDDDGGSSTGLIVGASLVLAVLVIGGAVLVARSRAAKDAAQS
jgi:hypothetical protein